MINIKIDSRKIEKGDTFVAIKGATVDGHDFIEKAIELGATRIVCEHKVPFDVEQVVVKSSQEWLTNYVSSTYSKDVNEMNILGITGTNGKTTTAYLTYQLLNKLGSKTAYIGTIGCYVPDEEIKELPNTTPDILDLYELLLHAKEKGCKNVIMEVSSHSLDQKRVQGIEFKVGAFTNLTQDHLDYHKTMENYLAAKKLILKQVSGKFIVNADDSYASSWYEYKDVFKLGKNGDDLKILNFENTKNGTLIKFNAYGKDYEVETNLINEFNVYNYLTALSFANALGYSIEEIIDVTKEIFPPKGRCEQIIVNDGMAVVDYAHTPDAVLKIVESFNKNKKNRIITVVGCGGDRDKTKRPIMGKIASDYSDFVVFTSDNPRTEDPNEILKDIIAGVDKNNYVVEVDRPTAIVKALDMMEKDDVVLLLGKGHEDYQIIGHTKIHLDDSEEVKKYIDKKSK